jgi:hypothetical protein
MLLFVHNRNCMEMVTYLDIFVLGSVEDGARVMIVASFQVVPKANILKPGRM